MIDGLDLIIANERANWGSNRSKIRQVVDFLHQQGLSPSVAITRHAGHATELAAAAVEQRADTIIVIGGDGTLNEVLNGLLAPAQNPAPGADTPNPQSAICNPQFALPRLGIIPIGSSNDFVKSLGLPLAWRQACQVILDGRVREIDVGQAGSHYFCSASCLGYFAEIAAGSLKMKGFRGSLRYTIPALGVIRRLGPGWDMTLTADRRTFQGVYGVLLVGNAARFGGLTMLPDARPDDGVLDCLLIETGSRWQALQLIPLVYRRALARHQKVTHFQVRSLSVALDRSTPVCHDGQMGASSLRSIEYRVLPRRLRVLC
jgi:diacylglycerol kinase (ATP)